MAPSITSPQGPGASAVRPAGSGALGSWALAPLQRPQADTGHPSRRWPHAPRGGPRCRGCSCSGRGPVHPSRAGDTVLEDRGAGAVRTPRRPRTSGPRPDIRPTPGPVTEPEPDHVGAPAPGPHRFLTLAGFNAAVELCRVAQRSRLIFFLDSQNTVTYPTAFEGPSQGIFINVSAEQGQRGLAVSYAAGAPSPLPLHFSFNHRRRCPVVTGPLDAAWLAQTQGTLLSSGVIPWHWGRLAPSACVTIESL